MAEAQLFDPGPATKEQANRQRPGDKVLYQPPQTRNGRYNRYRNIVVRAQLQVHMEERVPAATNQRTGNVKAAWGRVRSAFAEDWVALCREHGMVLPGKPQKVHHKKRDPHADAGQTCLRRFLEGTDQPDYLLQGIEATLAWRAGEPLPDLVVQGVLA